MHEAWEPLEAIVLPPEESVPKEEFKKLQKLKEVNVGSRPYVFAEFFAGMGGFSEGVKFVAADRVKVEATLDGYAGEWNILEENDYQRALGLCENELDHGHFAPPCRTLTMARRSDEHGEVPVLRSEERPEGWGDDDTKQANEMIVRMVTLCLRLMARGATFSIENPWRSFIWLLKVMQRLMRAKGAELLCLHQCAYGASSRKETGILTTAPWMKLVRRLCHETRPHLHATTLAGKAWDYVEDRWVWRTSLAAEYPCGLCLAWAKALVCWLNSSLGKKWVEQRTYVKVGKWNNVLVRKADLEGEKLGKEKEAKQTAKQVREEENKKAVGGLRNPRSAVTKSEKLRKLGRRLRTVIDSCYSLKEVEAMNADITCGASKELVLQARRKLCQEFGVEPKSSGLQPMLWRRILESAEDADAVVLPKWMEEGFPLGIKGQIENTGIFPSAEEDSAAVEASRMEGWLQGDADGSATNYSSYAEAGEPAEELLTQMVEADRTEVFQSWQEVQQRVGSEAKLTRLACITKTKENGEVKYRLVVDCRRSGVNGLSSVRERVILPKMTDFVKSAHHLLTVVDPHSMDEMELFSADFKDAFHMLPLRQDERQYVVYKNGKGQYHVAKVVVFGLSAGPLLWGRLASAAMRLAQATAIDGEIAMACYVDDPLLAVMGATAEQRLWSFCRCTLLWQSLGLEMSWKKSSRGKMVQWIGFEVKLTGPRNGDIQVKMAEAKRQKLLKVFQEMSDYGGMIPLRLLQYSTGVIAWASSVMTMSRPWLAMLYAAATRHQTPKKPSTRERKGLVFLKQVEHAIRWMNALVQEADALRPGLQHTFKWRPDAPVFLIQTDACPTGMGGFLMQGGRYVAYWHDKVSPEDLALLQATAGDPSYQSEWELLAVWISLEVFKKWLTTPESSPRVILRTDNTAAIQAAMEYRAKSPIMMQLAAEISIQVELMQLLPLQAEHVPGILNDLADKLSRLAPGEEAPAALREAVQLTPLKRHRSNFRAWP